MSTNNQCGLSSDKQEKSMLQQLLDQWELDYNRFSDVLGIDRQSLWQYRTGKREFRLSMEQIQRLEKLLKQVDKTFSDLPSDWYRDREVKNPQ